MDRFRTALQLHKDQQGHPGRKATSAKAAGSHEWPSPIVYTSTRSLNIPLAVLRQRRVMAAHDRGPFVDAFKILRTQVLQRLREHDWNVLGVTSPGHGEGKTLTAVNLAVSLAMETAQTVLLVDANLRNPSVHNVFGLGDCPGLADYLLDNQPLEDLLGASGNRPFCLTGGRTGCFQFIRNPDVSKNACVSRRGEASLPG